jgi:hypothetical protein
LVGDVGFLVHLLFLLVDGLSQGGLLDGLLSGFRLLLLCRLLLSGRLLINLGLLLLLDWLFGGLLLVCHFSLTFL